MLTKQLYVHQALPIATTGIHEDVVGTGKPAAAVGKLEQRAVLFLMNLQVLYMACVLLRRPALIVKTLKRLRHNVETIWGGSVQKVQKINGLYYLHLYAPPWPSALRNTMIRNELLHLAYPQQYPATLNFMFLAITRKCPLRCAHCYEWDNLGNAEAFTLEELKQAVDYFQQQDVQQIFFSGGEPMVRFRELLELIMHANKKSECFVLTSGVNLTRENADLLKRAGCKGVEVSIDHYIPAVHNAFRHNDTIFRQAVQAVQASLDAGLVTGISVCATKELIEGGHLEPYMSFAKRLGVHFVQVLEPRAVGHFAGKPVVLEQQHIDVLESFFTRFNNDPAYHDYPTILYNGYHQRRVGCYTGSHSIYVDSIGDVHACPFCHTRSGNIADLINPENNSKAVVIQECPAFGKTV